MENSVTNEELTAAIQAGNRELLPLLWEKNERLIIQLILKAVGSRTLPAHIDIDDIMQCGYFAMLAAVKAYKPSEYKFTAYLSYSVKNAVNEAIHGKSRRPKNAPPVISYNQMITGDDGNTTELLELLPDKGKENDIIEPIELDDLQLKVREAISELPERQNYVILHHYFYGRTLAEIAAEQGYSLETIRQQERQALRALRKNPKIIALYEDQQKNKFAKTFNFYSCSPEYFNAIRAAQRLEIELLQDHNLSYGQRQAQIFLLLYRAEQGYRKKEKSLLYG